MLEGIIVKKSQSIADLLTNCANTPSFFDRLYNHSFSADEIVPDLFSPAAQSTSLSRVCFRHQAKPIAA